MKIAKNLSELIGNTPMVKLQKMTEDLSAEIIVKLESLNPGGSVKDRLSKAMIEAAEESGEINKNTLIIEPTSGNTGIGLAMLCAAKGYKLILTMPESVSNERRTLIKAYGAELVLTPAEKGMKGAIDKANEISADNSNSFIPMQFNNPANPEMHRRTTAIEIWNDTEGKVDVFVTGVGTGGTLTGVGEVLKARNNAIKVIAVEPTKSPVLSGKDPGSHKIQGIGAGFIPKVMNTEILDEIFLVDDEDAFNTAKELATKEGILCGISSGGNVYAALQLAKRSEFIGKTIVTTICDTGERYLSTDLFNNL